MDLPLVARLITAYAAIGWVAPVLADELLHAFEGDVVPYDPSVGWVRADPCEGPCEESIESGHLVLRWPETGSPFGYRYDIARPGTLPPQTLWVEWRVRSNHPLGCCFYSCDAGFTVKYKGIGEHLFIYGDAAISFDVGSFVVDLAIEEFHTYRFESLDGIHYQVSVDGEVFLLNQRDKSNGYHSIAIFGDGGCGGDEIPNAINEWDFVRFGTIAYGEEIIGSDPPPGFIDSGHHPLLDRFTVTYDSPNSVYIDEISMTVTPAESFEISSPVFHNPSIVSARRIDNCPADVIEIVLDRPIPYNATTRFTFNDGTLSQFLEFTYSPGDTDGDGDADLADFDILQSCFGVVPPPGPCLVFDTNEDEIVDSADLALFIASMTKPSL